MKHVLADCGHDATQDGRWPIEDGQEVCLDCWEDLCAVEFWQMVNGELTLGPERMRDAGQGLSTNELWE